MKVFFDTNVVLDVLQAREVFLHSSAQLISLVEATEITGYLCATTLTTLHYLIAKSSETKTAQKQIQKLLSYFEVAPVNRVVISNALALNFSDFEDAVICAAAIQSDADCIVTRDRTGFRRSPLKTYTPDELLAALRSK
jgi:predicted nucleic acid-binding protein